MNDQEHELPPMKHSVHWHEKRPLVKIRVNAVGRGSITIDDGPELPVRKLRIFSGVNQATVVRFDLIAVNVDAEMPVDELPLCGHPSSVSERTCNLPAGHAQWKPERFHRFDGP